MRRAAHKCQNDGVASYGSMTPERREKERETQRESGQQQDGRDYKNHSDCTCRESPSLRVLPFIIQCWLLIRHQCFHSLSITALPLSKSTISLSNRRHSLSIWHLPNYL